MADITPFDALLGVQSHDLALAQLRHRRDHLPEAAQLHALDARRKALTEAEAPTRADLAALDVRQSELEAEIHRLDTKIGEVNATLYGGTVTSPKELQAFQADIESLRRRRSELEDVELQILMGREPLDAVLVAGEADRAKLSADEAALRAIVGDVLELIERDVQQHTEARAEVVRDVPADLLRTYEAARTRNRGIGAARLESGRCAGCHLSLPSVELDRLRKLPKEALVTCDQCGAVLVR